MFKWLETGKKKGECATFYKPFFRNRTMPSANRLIAFQKKAKFVSEFEPGSQGQDWVALLLAQTPLPKSSELFIGHKLLCHLSIVMQLLLKLSEQLEELDKVPQIPSVVLKHVMIISVWGWPDGFSFGRIPAGHERADQRERQQQEFRRLRRDGNLAPRGPRRHQGRRSRSF